jgi:RNA polymerase sigma factor (sigma-70 family)
MSAPLEQPKNIDSLVDHLFRREAGKMVSVLTRIFGFDAIEVAEDIVQDTMYKALQEWPFNRVPDNPQAWLYKVARNKAIDMLRRQKKLVYNTDSVAAMALMEKNVSGKIDDLFLEHEIEDSQLRMIFACCAPEINTESQIALTLKTPCGFSIKEIAKAFVTGEDTINKRLLRAKQKIRAENISMEVPTGARLALRLQSVLKTIYLLFNEGYNASAADMLIRKDICLEAMRLAILLTEQPVTNVPETQALLALMCFHAARFDSRMDTDGSIILLREQDRKLWNRELIQKGFQYLNEASADFVPNEYNIEAGIMAVHCAAESYAATDWQTIFRLYESLLEIKDTPVVKLNKAIVIGQIEGPQAAINEILTNVPMKDYYLYHATLGELYLQTHETDRAKKHLQEALTLTGSNAEKLLLQKKLDRIN